MLRRYSANNTHLYPGALLRVPDDDDRSEPSPGDEAVIEFSDGVIVNARWLEAGADGLVLRMPAWRTERGTEVEARTWRITPGDETDVLKVGKRVA